jgi:UDP-N-acetylglucosamine 2-epimerase (non-hydrolysing)
MARAAIQIFIGTKAQYIKTAPVILELERRGVPYRLIDSGQHGAFSRSLRSELGIRDPDYVFGAGRDVATIGAALLWSFRLLGHLVSRKRLRQEVFPGGVVCVVHGDTPSTLLAALLARRAGLDVAHLEAGLRSFSYLNPFPEELIRVAVMKLSTLLFAPSPEAFANLERMRTRGRLIQLSGNTVVESLVTDTDVTEDGPPVVTLHRVENLHRSPRLQRLLETVRSLAEQGQVLFVIHPPTEEAIERQGLSHLLNHPNIEVQPLLPHDDFVAHLRRAPFVITDGGSIQEECAILGVPTLLWRNHTERSDGIGENVVLSRFDQETIAAFLAAPQHHRRQVGDTTIRPSTQIVDHLTSHA